MEVVLFLRLTSLGGVCSAQERWCLWVSWNSAQGLWWLSLQPSLERHNPVSPCMIPVYRELQSLLRDPAGANKSGCTSHLRGHLGI